MSDRGKTGAWARVVLLLVWAAGLSAPAFAWNLELQWDPSPDSRVTGYRVYVGSASGLYERVEDVGLKTTFVLTNAEPGKRYFFAAVAVAGDITSELSAEISAVVGEQSTTPGLDGTAPDAAYPFGSDPRRTSTPLLSGETCTQAGRSCFQYAQLGPSVGRVSSLSAAANGLLFLVEDGTRIRWLTAAGQLAADPAYVSRDDARLAQVVVDPAFASTSAVFVSEVVQRRDGTVELNILRQRFLAGSLGESAAVVTGIPVDAKSLAPFAVSPAGVLYVAVPASNGQRNPDAGHVLAFAPDGRPLRDPASGRLVAGDGLPEPVAMWMAGDTGTLWLAGRDQAGQSNTGVVDMTGRARQPLALDGDPAATAGPLGVIVIPDRTVLATAPGESGTIVAAVGPAPSQGPIVDRTTIVVLRPIR